MRQYSLRMVYQGHDRGGSWSERVDAARLWVQEALAAARKQKPRGGKYPRIGGRDLDRHVADSVDGRAREVQRGAECL
jgi:hypothetical protein